MKQKYLIVAACLWIAGPTFAQETLLWSEEFDSGTQPDERIWTYDIGFGANGWGNRELQYYTSDPENVSIENGMLHIRALPQTSGPPFTSGRIKTEDKLTVQYGTIEARIKVPDLADGLWPAFWTLGNNFSEVGWPMCGELDIMEMGNSTAIAEGLVNRRVGSTAHWDNAGQYASFGAYLDAPADLDEGFHIFRMEWTPEFVTTFLDGRQIWQIDIRPANCVSCTEFHQPHFMLLNMAVGGTYTGILGAGGVSAALPAELIVDWVRIYDNGFTELAGSGLEAGGAPPIGPGHSGSWYSEGQSGHGFSLEFGTQGDGSPFAVAYWYIYDSVGNPIFFVGSGVPEANTVELDFVSPVGMAFGVFDPTRVTREPAGTGRFEFLDRGTGTFIYEPSSFSINEWGHSAVIDLPVTKLFGIPTADDSYPAGS